MRGDRIETSRLRATAALALVVLAVFLRILVPAGWMPATSGNGYAITLCTGIGSISAWVDDKGKIHKEAPAKAKTDHPCAFAGFSAAMDLPAWENGLAITPHVAAYLHAPLATAAAVGRGLAAPPPPPTGPPASL